MIAIVKHDEVKKLKEELKEKSWIAKVKETEELIDETLVNFYNLVWNKLTTKKEGK